MPGRTGESDIDSSVRKPCPLPLLGDLMAKQGADRAIDVPHWKVDRYVFAIFNCRLRQRYEFLVEGLVEAVILADTLNHRLFVGILRDGENG